MNEADRYVDPATPEEIMARRAQLAADMQAHADRMRHYILYGNSKPPKQPAANRPELETRTAPRSAG